MYYKNCNIEIPANKIILIMCIFVPFFHSFCDFKNFLTAPYHKPWGINEPLCKILGLYANTSGAMIMNQSVSDLNVWVCFYT